MTRSFVRAVILGLGAFKIVDLLKQLSGWPLQPKTKTAALVVVTAGLSAAFNDGPSDAVLTGLGTIGVAELMHRTDRVLRNIGDEYQLRVMEKATRSSRAMNRP